MAGTGSNSSSILLRRRIQEALARSERPLSVSELAEHFEISSPRMHYHLKVLERDKTVLHTGTEAAGATVHDFYAA